MKEYRRTYWPFAVWLIALVPALGGAALIAERAGLDGRGMTASAMAALLAMMALLFGMVWKGEYVYWISGGPSFEQARAAGSAVRRAYALRHLDRILQGCLAALLLLAAECAFGAGELAMILSVAACIVAAGVSMVKIRWPEENEYDSKH